MAAPLVPLRQSSVANQGAPSDWREEIQVSQDLARVWRGFATNAGPGASTRLEGVGCLALVPLLQ
eukprot:7496669-Alexandrium_andersonii.AAC.1